MAIWAIQKAKPQDIIFFESPQSKWNVSLFTSALVNPFKKRTKPNAVYNIWPMTVAQAAPETPRSRTPTKRASSIIFVTAPMPVTHMPRTGLPDTRTKSHNTWVIP